MKAYRIIYLILVSIFRFPWNVFWLRLKRDRLGKIVDLDQAGSFVVFRETKRLHRDVTEPTVLVIGFRLKLIDSNVFMHWLFQRICILTTPFWSGLSGLKTKLWMVDPNAKNYLGIYEWQGRKNAQQYIGFLIPILRIFSINHTIWHKYYYKTRLENFLPPRTK